jgi:hypothetical protein
MEAAPVEEPSTADEPDVCLLLPVSMPELLAQTRRRFLDERGGRNDRKAPRKLPCEECGTLEESGFELWDDSIEHDLAEHDPAEPIGVSWCPNLSCPSNIAFKGFLRISPREYRCDTCGQVIEAYIGRVRAHRTSHRGY